MQTVTLRQFLKKTKGYERMPININPALRRGVWLGWISTVIFAGLYQWLPSGSYLMEAPFFLWSGYWVASTWNLVACHRQFLVMACGLVFSITGGLLFATRGFYLAEISLHIALLIPVIFAAVNTPFVAILLLPFATNLALWLFLVVSCVTLGALLLFAFFVALSR